MLIDLKLMPYNICGYYLILNANLHSNTYGNIHAP